MFWRKHAGNIESEKGIKVPAAAVGSSLHSICYFGGVGGLMMRGRIKAKNVDMLELMMEGAIKAGVRMVACQMSMDIMGVTREELMDGVEIGGVATYMEAASEGNVNLFI